MKKINFSHLLMLLAAVLFMAVSCTKEGPQGEQGVAGAGGTNGTNGTDGTDGVDGNAACIVCHTVAKKDAVTAKYKMSTHFNSNLMYTGQTIYEYAGEGPGRTTCTGCHSEQGFVAWQYTGELTYPDTNGLQTAMPVGCVACHDTHDTFDFENDGVDYALRTSAPVQLMMYTEESVELDLGGNSNLCANCHQPRTAPPVIASADSFNITSPYWGPHHGPHATTLEGFGAFEIGAGYPTPGSSTHRTGSSCTSCHMHKATEAVDEETGGHTFHVPIDACTGCHQDATDFNYNNIQTEVNDMLAQLKQKFIDNNMWDEGSDHIIPGTYPLNWAGSYYNYVWVLDDRSGGVHNPDYINALLINSIAVFN